MRTRWMSALLGAAVVGAMVVTAPGAWAAAPSPMTTPSAATPAAQTAPARPNPQVAAGPGYAVDLVAAWSRGDTAAVKKMSTPEVAATLLAFTSPAGSTWVHTSSRTIGDLMYSSFVNSAAGKALVIGVSSSALSKSADHAATVARFVDYPVRPRMNPVTYAVDLVAAWGRGDTATVKKMATPEVAATLWGFANPGGPNWVNTSHRRIGHIMYSSFVNRPRGKALVIGVDETVLAKSADRAATVARFVNYPVKPRMTAVEYAVDLVAAWGAGDTVAVARMTTPEVAATLWAFAKPGGTHWVNTSHRRIGDIMYSSFVDRTRGKALVLGVNEKILAASFDHAATVARFVDYPRRISATQYADQLIAAWGAGDTAKVKELATAAVAGQLFEYANPGGTDWTRIKSEGTAGTIYVTYRSATHHEELTVGVNDTIDLTGAKHAVYRATFAPLA